MSTTADIPVAFSATVKDDNLAQLWDTLATAMGSTVGELMRERAGMMGRYLASATMPVVVDGEATTGDSNAARKIGQNAVRRELRQMFIRHRGTTPRPHRWRKDLFFYKNAAGYPNVAPLRPVITDEATLKATHHQHRRFGGKKHAQTGFLVLASVYDAYEKKVLARVGWAKSGFMSAAADIPGAKGLTQAPKWMRQPAPGSADDRTNNETNPSYFLENDVPYVSEIFSARQMARAEDRFERSLTEELRRRIRYLTKAA